MDIVNTQPEYAITLNVGEPQQDDYLLQQMKS